MSKNHPLLKSITELSNIDFTKDSTDEILKNLSTVSNRIKASTANLPSQPQVDPKKIEEDNINNLKHIFHKAKHTAETAPSKLNIAEKNYYQAEYGKQAWMKKEREKFRKDADNEVKFLEDTHNKKVDNIHTKINAYNNSLNNSKILDNYIKKLKNENKQLITKVDNSHAESNTTHRKIWYIYNENKSMETFKNILKYAYIAVVIIYIVYFFKKKLWKPGGYRPDYRIDIFLLILFILWPFISIKIMRSIFAIVKYILSFVPRDKYNKL